MNRETADTAKEDTVEHIGKITYLKNCGIGHVLEKGRAGIRYGFKFRAIKGYAGEPVEELKAKGIFVGAIVEFTRDEQGRVHSIEPLFFNG